MAQIQLNELTSGIVRLRTKSGSDPHTLYDLENGFVDIDGTIRSRPGTTALVSLPPGTKGLCAYNGGLVVFGIVAQVVTASTPAVEVVVITDPNDPTQPIANIWYAAPFMGFLYVVAEFANGDVVHFWLRSDGVWTATTDYKDNDIVTPSVPNGLAYKASARNPPDAWRPGTQYAVGDEVQPTVYNGFKYKVTATSVAGSATGETEPTWTTDVGAAVVEDATSGSGAPPPGTPTAPPTAHDTIDPSGRYINPGGNNPKVLP